MEKNTMTTKNTDSTLELCDVIVTNIEKSYDTLELCEHIVAECLDRAAWEAFRETHLGRLVVSGVKVRLECKTIHDGIN